MAENDKKLHIVMFPWLAFGHLVPFLGLAKFIAQKGHRISFISTPRNIDRLPKLPPNLLSLINFVKLPLPHVDNLPQNAEATIDVPYNKIQYLKKAYDGLQEPMTRFLQTSDPDWVFYDFAPYWLGPIAANLGISCAFFSIFLAATVCTILEPTSNQMDVQDDRKEPEDFTVPPKWVPFPSNIVFRYFEVLKIFDGASPNESGVSDLYRFNASMRGCDFLAVRSCAEFEPEWFPLLEELHRKPVIPVGMLLPTTEYDFGDDKDDEWGMMKEWLDKQEKGSVVYVAFGTESKLSQEELTELALGLELSGLPFFWVIRKRGGSADTELIELPEGFEERTKGRGVVCTSWAPQLRILSHDSVGGFLTHSGWNSVMEAIQFERALILLAFFADTGLNARVLEEKKIGYSIPRNEKDGSFTRDSVAESLRLVVVEEEGKIYRDKVKEMRRLFGDKDRQDKFLDNLLDYLHVHKHLHKEWKIFSLFRVLEDFQPGEVGMNSLALASMADNDKLHIVMFPWLAFGHLIPFLELTKLIAQKGHRISFLSTPRNIDRLPKLPPNLLPLINFVKLPLPHVPNLPQNAEATIDIPYDKVQYLKKAYDGLQQPMTRFLETSDPDWVIHDFAPYWLAPIAANLGISSAVFSIFFAASLCTVLEPTSNLVDVQDDRKEPEDFTVPPKWIPFPSNVAFRYFEILKIFDVVAVNESGVSDTHRFIACIRGCDFLAVRTCAEFEPEWLPLLEELHRKPVIPVGMLPTTEYDFGDDNDEWGMMKEWLDKQEKGSVVFVAFGTESKLSQVELTELALGLELSGLPFFWVLRKNRGSTDTNFIELPEGFEERTKGRGVVCTSWAPQLKILGHDSVGGFLTHSGWSSVVEALQFERPLILFTFLADTGLIARVLEEKKIGYTIPRNEKDGSFTRDSVAESLRLVVVADEGKIYKDKAKEMRGLFGDRDRQDKYVDNLLGYLCVHKYLHKAPETCK